MIHPVSNHILATLEMSYVMKGAAERRSITNWEYHLDWNFHSRRMINGANQSNVLSIKTFELEPRFRRLGILTGFVSLLLDAERGCRIPFKFLHFQECNSDIGAALEKMNFHKYQIAQATDYWKRAPVKTKELV